MADGTDLESVTSCMSSAIEGSRSSGLSRTLLSLRAAWRSNSAGSGAFRMLA